MSKDEQIKMLRDALCQLLNEVECLDDITFSRDIEPYKAEACWEDALDTAAKALKETA
jgi:hypothetical protein